MILRKSRSSRQCGTLENYAVAGAVPKPIAATVLVSCYPIACPYRRTKSGLPRPARRNWAAQNELKYPIVIVPAKYPTWSQVMIFHPPIARVHDPAVCASRIHIREERRNYRRGGAGRAIRNISGDSVPKLTFPLLLMKNWVYVVPRNSARSPG